MTDTVMAEFLCSPTKTLDTMIEAFEIVGDGDAINYGSFWPYGLCYDFMAKVRVPGVDLAENEMWQVEEKELLAREDYERIVALGWPEFFDRFMKERILDDVPAERLPPSWKFPDVRSAWSERGVPVLSGGDVTTPIELLCGTRSFFEFFIDLAEIPDVVEAAMEAIVPHLTARTVRAAEQRGLPCSLGGRLARRPLPALPRNVAAIRLAVLQPGRARGRGLGVDRCSPFGFRLDA